MAEDLTVGLRASIARQEELLRSSLVLNPVENFPFPEDLAVASSHLHGLYNSDKHRGRAERVATPIQFAGRQQIEIDSRAIYAKWAQALGAADVTLRILSGLHSHIVLFMAMARPNQTVLLLPVKAGGHLSTKAILERLGLKVVDMVANDEEMCVDMEATFDRCAGRSPDFVFVDRSEGLVFEDFSPLAALTDATHVFDASQFLTNVIAGDHPNPFGWGADLMVASVHKNFPGPQKALLATRHDDDVWREILRQVSVYVSNMHSASTYAAGLTLSRSDWLSNYSRQILDLAVLLEDELHANGVPVMRRPRNAVPTHHLWIREESRERAYVTYERLEECLIMTNFRTLPYSLGHGLRLGVNAAVRLGLTADDVPRLAELIADIRTCGATPSLKREARSFNRALWSKQEQSCH